MDITEAVLAISRGSDHECLKVRLADPCQSDPLLGDDFFSEPELSITAFQGRKERIKAFYDDYVFNSLLTVIFFTADESDTAAE